MINKIHILGASGSGTTTLAETISLAFNYKHFDTDDFYWIKSEPPFQQKREVNKRIQSLKESIDDTERWVLSGSLCGWGDVFIPYFDLVIYLWIPQEIRMDRLITREKHRYGKDIEVGGKLYKANQEFITWASKYDSGDINIRSKKLHNEWLKKIDCLILKIEDDIALDEKLYRVNKILSEHNN